MALAKALSNVGFGVFALAFGAITVLMQHLADPCNTVRFPPLKGAAPADQAARMSLFAHASLAARGVSAFFDWVDSDANPADPLSRLGFTDPFVSERLALGAWVRFPVYDLPSFGSAPDFFQLIFSFFSALGSGAPHSVGLPARSHE